MAESWEHRLRREAGEMDAALRALFAAPPPDDAALRGELERLAQRPHFAAFTWFWGPRLASRNRVLFRPFILSNFSGTALDARGRFISGWRGEQAEPLQRWLAEADAADDVELTRRLYRWKLQATSGRRLEQTWRQEVLRRAAAAPSPAARFTALAKIDVSWVHLDAVTAARLYELDPGAARAFILDHLPWFGWGGQSRAEWEGLLQASRARDPDFHFELYRRIADERRWRTDVLGLCRSVAGAAALDEELERRHPRSHHGGAAAVFHELVKARGRDVVPYVLRHAESVFPRWGFGGPRDAKGLPELLALADREGWLDLWATLLRTGAAQAHFDAAVKRLVRSTLPEAEIRMRLSLVAGHGREVHGPGFSVAQVHALDEATALALYERFPELVRGPFRMHVAPGWHSAYPQLVRAAVERGDAELVDFLAARAGIQDLRWIGERGWPATIALLSNHYESLPELEFVQRAANALSRMPAFAVWDYDELLRTNRLARLLFERSTALYLSDAMAVRDLLESAQIHVQALAFRILGADDPRAPAVAARSADLLQASLFRPLHRRTRLAAFRALERATAADEATARYLLGRMREALVLPDQRYPKEQLVGLLGKVLHRWPALRGPGEVPRVYGRVQA